LQNKKSKCSLPLDFPQDIATQLLQILAEKMYNGEFGTARELAYQFLDINGVQHANRGDWFEPTKIMDVFRSTSVAIQQLCRLSIRKTAHCASCPNMETLKDLIGIHLLEPTKPTTVQHLIDEFFQDENLSCSKCLNLRAKEKSVTEVPQILHLFINRRTRHSLPYGVTPSLQIELGGSMFKLTSYGLYDGSHHWCRLHFNEKSYHYDGYPQCQFFEIPEKDLITESNQISFVIYSRI